MEVIRKDGSLIVRYAERRDVSEIRRLIEALAEYEKMPECCLATDEKLEQSIFDRGEAKVLMAEYDGVIVGFALYYYTYSTWMANKGIHLDDLFVYPEYRGKGIGKKLLTTLADIACKENCSRFEWWCLDWNTPSIEFYRSMGASSLDGFMIFRAADKALEEMAKK